MISSKENLKAIIEEYGDMILRIAYTYLKNYTDAEDIMQDVFIKLIEKMPEFNDKTHEKSWIIRVTINLCKNKLTSYWRKNINAVDDADKLHAIDNYNEGSEVLDAVLALPNKYKIIVYLYYYEGYSTKEISKIINKPDGTVRSILSRSREKLKKALKEEYDFE